MAFSSSDSQFAAAVSYALQKFGKAGIVLKPEQQQVVRHVYEGRDVFLWLPTGFGKSICYEVLPFLLDLKLDSEYSSMGIVVVGSRLGLPHRTLLSGDHLNPD